MADKVNFDPYELLGLQEDCNEKSIISAYRKMSLKWHPDKNPHQLIIANEMFLKIQKALEILTDSAAKAALDRLRKARKAAKIRNKDLDEKRRKLKEELESREQGVTTSKEEEDNAAKNFEAEIARLRKEGSKLLQKEKEEIERLVKEEQRKHNQSPSSSSMENNVCRLKVTWKANKNEEPFYNDDNLLKIFSKYGEIVVIVISKKSKGSALIEFVTVDSAELAAKNEKGDAEHPLVVTWINRPPTNRETPPVQNAASDLRSTESPILVNLIDHEDFESYVLTKMKQAEERKKLIDDIKDVDNE